MITMAKTQGKFNIYEHVTNTVVEAIEAGTVPWRKGWTGGGSGLPLRATGEPYRGVNVLLLWIEAHVKGYGSPSWMTYKQAQVLGGQVRKGETSTTVVKYGTYEGQSEDLGLGEDAKKPVQRAYARAYRVFNVAQIDGLPDPYYRTSDPARDLGTQIDPEVMAWFERLDIPIDTTTEPAAYYTPGTDRIHMPPVQTFVSAGAYFGTLSHEAAHGSGHSSRLNRQHEGTARARYAKEEVVVELTAAFVATRLGIETEYDQNAAYLVHWLRVLKQDSRAVMQAASQAQAACDWMFEQAGALEGRPAVPAAA